MPTYAMLLFNIETVPDACSRQYVWPYINIAKTTVDKWEHGMMHSSDTHQTLAVEALLKMIIVHAIGIIYCCMLERNRYRIVLWHPNIGEAGNFGEFRGLGGVMGFHPRVRFQYAAHFRAWSQALIPVFVQRSCVQAMVQCTLCRWIISSHFEIWAFADFTTMHRRRSRLFRKPSHSGVRCKIPIFVHQRTFWPEPDSDCVPLLAPSDGILECVDLGPEVPSISDCEETPQPQIAPQPQGSTERIQIIDNEKKFTPDLETQVERWGLRDVGFGYNIVAVFGSQSTGKSTLLNRLFGTTFDVMDESKRQQTTKGIWMCRGKDMNVMVMDVEGTDGRERGEDQDFERKSALFSLASSEILIVNLWEHQVGLYQGANMGLLKTVLEVNLGLFGKKAVDGTKNRTLLLFVIRDHIGTTPLTNLQATLTADLQKIWDSVSKPPELASVQLSDYFDLAFEALPHKILAAQKFEEEFRCDEIAGVAVKEVGEGVRMVRREVEGGRVIDGLGASMRGWRGVALGGTTKNMVNRVERWIGVGADLVMLVYGLQRNFKKQIAEPVELALNKASPDMWDHVLATFKKTLDKAENTYLAKAKSFDCTEENATSLATLRKCAWLALRAKIDEQTVWKPDDDIDGACKKAKDQTLELIPLYSKISPIDPSLEYTLPSDPSTLVNSSTADEEFDFPSTLLIFTDTKSLDLSTKFRRDADAYYVEAKRSTVSSVAQIPYWMYGVLVVLGWNEAMAVLFNPLYFTFLLIALVTTYAIIQLGLVGPLFQVTRTIGNEVQRQASNRLREHFSQPVLAEPVRTRPIEDAFENDEVADEVRRRRVEPM
ncbi:hypothetical protein PILCRDRAFT_88083 [Piloderma croceum F 1598]|uniref:GB1/RHD3-type G domain-containing protein n=1 Tax=Piloderma croceum (strain F 1598) TaxID=765440 RepID=A0A0C3C0U0_PILCF|nr:hypothetical protein PILCRDRAFT_88083 [Piloderma croceum F 1598]